ncbi:MAG: hypothetical protein ABR600_10735 [Actinomycetota bacterium]
MRFARWLAIVGLVVVAAACGGGNGTSVGSSSGSNPPGSTPGSGGQAGGGAVAQLKTLGVEWSKTSAKVTYGYTGGTSGAQKLGNFTLYWMPPSAWRVDLDIAGSTSTIIHNGDKSYVCGGGGGAACVSVPGAQGAGSLPFLGAFADPEGLSSQISDALSGADLEESSDTIAGQDAKCYAASGGAAGSQGKVEWCFAKDGILLRYLASASGAGGAGSFGLEATDVSRDVSASDFEPPYPVTPGY